MECGIITVVVDMYRVSTSKRWWLPNSQCDRQSVVGEGAGDVQDVEDIAECGVWNHYSGGGYTPCINIL